MPGDSSVHLERVEQTLVEEEEEEGEVHLAREEVEVVEQEL